MGTEQNADRRAVVRLDHGADGRLMRELVRTEILPRLENEHLSPLDDAALLTIAAALTATIALGRVRPTRTEAAAAGALFGAGYVLPMVVALRLPFVGRGVHPGGEEDAGHADHGTGSPLQ